MSKARTIVRLLSRRGFDAYQQAWQFVNESTVAQLFPDKNQREALELLLRQLKCEDSEKGLRAIALAAKRAALAESDRPLNALEAIKFAKEVERSAHELARLLKSEIQNEWLSLYEYMADFEGSERTNETQLQEEDLDSAEVCDAVERLHRCVDDLEVIQRGCQKAEADAERRRAELRTPKRPALNQIANSILAWLETGLIRSESTFSNDAPVADLFRFTCELADQEVPANVAYYLRGAAISRSN